VRRDGDALVIRNAAGEELRGRPSNAGGSELEAEHPQAGHPYVRALLQEAAMALGLSA
jgi:single-stranded-DNA-specific exonuclease